MKIGKYGIEIFDNRPKEYGGHGHKIAKFLNWQYSYIYIGFCYLRFGYSKEYYDGLHCCIWLGLFYINYGK